MRLWLRLAVTLLVLAGAAVAAWTYVNRAALTRQWMCYRIGAAEGFPEARRAIQWFENGADRESRLRELVEKWGTGNPRFDLHLARYVDSPDSSNALRKRFSLELAWRKGLLTRWAHYWKWQAHQEPDEKIASILAYLDALASTNPPKSIPWREVLDLQAIFCLTGHTELAKRLKPSNWHDRYGQWQEDRPAALAPVARPAAPFPDWKGRALNRTSFGNQSW